MIAKTHIFLLLLALTDSGCYPIRFVRDNRAGGGGDDDWKWSYGNGAIESPPAKFRTLCQGDWHSLETGESPGNKFIEAAVNLMKAPILPLIWISPVTPKSIAWECATDTVIAADTASAVARATLPP